MNTNEKLWLRFTEKWALNQRGGITARVSRWRIFHWLFLQKLGLKLWVEGRLFFDEKMWLLTGETNSKSLLGFGYEEAALSAFMLKFIQPGMCVIDVGAHLGYEAILASVLVGLKGRVVCFEPQPQISSWTERNLGRFPQARVVKSAAGDYLGTTTFYELPLVESGQSSRYSDQNSGRKIQVPIAPLKDLLLDLERPVHFIKCDVEGAEMSVLRGVVDILKKDQPILILEGEMPEEGKPRARVEEFGKFLMPLGYIGLSFEFDGELHLAPIGELNCGHANVAYVPAIQKKLFQI